MTTYGHGFSGNNHRLSRGVLAVSRVWWERPNRQKW
jgi:hypothetical protein